MSWGYFQKFFQVRRSVALVALALFVVRAAIPVGFMPASAAQVADGLILVMCPAQDPLPLSHMPSPSRPAHGDKATSCPFAASAVALSSSDDGFVDGIAFGAVRVPIVLETRRTAVIIYGLQEARAPPFFLG